LVNIERASEEQLRQFDAETQAQYNRLFRRAYRSYLQLYLEGATELARPAIAGAPPPAQAEPQAQAGAFQTPMPTMQEITGETPQPAQAPQAPKPTRAIPEPESPPPLEKARRKEWIRRRYRQLTRPEVGLSKDEAEAIILKELQSSPNKVRTNE